MCIRDRGEVVADLAVPYAVSVLSVPRNPYASSVLTLSQNHTSSVPDAPCAISVQRRSLHPTLSQVCGPPTIRYVSTAHSPAPYAMSVPGIA
eukprot:203740-Rhodomonas_salina.2